MSKKNITKEIIENLYAGKYKFGDKLPSLNEMAIIKKTSVSTVKGAYHNLVYTGVLYKKQGKGFFISKYWDNNIISSPTIDGNYSKTVAIEINDNSFFKEYSDLKNKLMEGRWKKFVKFYYVDNVVARFNVIMVNSNTVMNLSLEDIQKSFISYLYSSGNAPSGEVIETSTRPSIKKESGILNMPLNALIIVENFVSTNEKNEIIAFTKSIVNPKFYNFKIYKRNPTWLK